MYQKSTWPFFLHVEPHIYLTTNLSMRDNFTRKIFTKIHKLGRKKWEQKTKKKNIRLIEKYSHKYTSCGKKLEQKNEEERYRRFNRKIITKIHKFGGTNWSKKTKKKNRRAFVLMLSDLIHDPLACKLNSRMSLCTRAGHFSKFLLVIFHFHSLN